MDKLKKNLNSSGLGLLVAALVARRSGPQQHPHPRPRRRWAWPPWPPTSSSTGDLKRASPAILPLLLQPSPDGRPDPGHPGPGQLLRVAAPQADRLHRGQAPQPVRPVGHRAQGPQGGRLLQGLLPRGQLRPGGLENLLKIYAYHSPRVKDEFIDPDKNPGLVKRYDVTQDGTTIIEAGDKDTRITDDHRGGRDQRPDQGDPGPEEDRLLPRRATARSPSTRPARTAIPSPRPSWRSSVTRSRSRPWPWPTGSPRTAPCSSSPGPQKDLRRTSSRRSGLPRGRRPGPLPGRSPDAALPAALPGRLRLQARERHRRRHGLPAARRRLLHARRQRVRAARHHRQVPLRHVLPLARSVEVGETKPEGATSGPGQDEPQLLVRARARPEGGQVHRTRKAGADRPGGGFVVQDQAAPSPAPAGPSPASRPTAARPAERPKRRPASPSSATPISPRTAITACPATATSSSTSPTG